MVSILATLAAALCAVLCCMPAVHACGETLLSADMGNHPGSYQLWNRAQAEADFPAGLRFDKGIERAEVGESSLRVLQRQGKVGFDNTGMQFKYELGRSVSSATLQYDVKFDEGYDWTAGGKLPGLCDHECPTGCVDMDTHPGWSSRLMFRPGGALESYMYYPQMDEPGTCGASWHTPGRLSTGSWHTITLYIQLNDGGSSNGVQKVWLDGEEVLSRDDVKFRHGNDAQISQYRFECFHGGKSDNFKPSHDQHISFKNMRVSEGLCAPGDSPSSLIFEESDYDSNLGEAPAPAPAPEDDFSDKSDDDDDDDDESPSPAPSPEDGEGEGEGEGLNSREQSDVGGVSSGVVEEEEEDDCEKQGFTTGDDGVSCFDELGHYVTKFYVRPGHTNDGNEGNEGYRLR